MLWGRPSGESEVDPGADTGEEAELKFKQKASLYCGCYKGMTKQQGQWLPKLEKLRTVKTTTKMTETTITKT